MDSTTNGVPYLPLEVFRTIVLCLPKQTLKNVRLCNKALKTISEPLLFHSITLVPNLNFLVEFHATFCQSSVRRLVHRIDYDDRWLATIENYNADIRKVSHNDGIIDPIQKRVMKKLDSFKQYYLTDSDEALEISHLTRIFRALSAEQLWTMDERMDGIVFLFETIPIAIRRLYLEYLTHHPLKQKHVINSAKGGYTSPAKTRLFRCWMASYAAERPFKTVCAINLIWYSFLGVQMSKKSLASLRPILKDVEKLDLQWHAKKRQLGYFNTIYLDRVYNLLKLAPNLVHLRLMLHGRSLTDVEQDMSFEESQIAPLLGLSEGFCFTGLKVLALNSFVTYEHELINLFESAPSLTHLDLRNIVLLRETADRPRGCFVKIIQAIRFHLRLTRVVFGGYLSNGGNQLWYLNDKHSSSRTLDAQRERSLMWRIKQYITTNGSPLLPRELLRNAVTQPHNDVLPPSPSMPWVKGDYTWSMTLRLTPPPDLTFFEEQEDLDENDVTPPLSPLHNYVSLGVPPPSTQPLPSIQPPVMPPVTPKPHLTLSDILGGSDHGAGSSGAPSVAPVKLGADAVQAKTAKQKAAAEDLWGPTSFAQAVDFAASSSATGAGKAASLSANTEDILENFDFDSFLNGSGAGDFTVPTAKTTNAGEKDFLGQAVDKAKSSMKQLQNVESDHDDSDHDEDDDGEDNDGEDAEDEDEEDDEDDTESQEDVNGDKMVIDFSAEDEDSHDSKEDNENSSHSVDFDVDDESTYVISKSHPQGSGSSYAAAGGVNGHNGYIIPIYPPGHHPTPAQSLQNYKAYQQYQKEQAEKKQLEGKEQAEQWKQLKDQVSKSDPELAHIVAMCEKEEDQYIADIISGKKPPMPGAPKDPAIVGQSLEQIFADWKALPGMSFDEKMGKMGKFEGKKGGLDGDGIDKGIGKGEKDIDVGKGDETEGVDWKPANGSVRHNDPLPWSDDMIDFVKAKYFAAKLSKAQASPQTSSSVPETMSTSALKSTVAAVSAQLEARSASRSSAQLPPTTSLKSPEEQALTHVHNLLTFGASKWTLSRQINSALASATASASLHLPTPPPPPPPPPASAASALASTSPFPFSDPLPTPNLLPPESSSPLSPEEEMEDLGRCSSGISLT